MPDVRKVPAAKLSACAQSLAVLPHWSPPVAKMVAANIAAIDNDGKGKKVGCFCQTS